MQSDSNYHTRVLSEAADTVKYKTVCGNIKNSNGNIIISIMKNVALNARRRPNPLLFSKGYKFN